MIALIRTLSALAITCAALIAGGVELGAKPTLAPSFRAPQLAADPATNSAALAAFTSAARADICADVRNRLFVIDNKFIFRDTAGTCADSAHAQLLYGATPEQVLCVDGELMGKVCYHERHQALFLTLSRNAGLPDLGLGNEHSVVEIALAERP